MPGVCQLSGCCMAPLLFRYEQQDDNQLSPSDHLEESRGWLLAEEVSVFVSDASECFAKSVCLTI